MKPKIIHPFYCIAIVLLIVTAGLLRAQGIGADTDFLYARKLYDDKMYSLSAQEFSRFIRNYPNDPRVPDARYLAGMSHFNLNQYDAARREFQFLAIDFPKDKRAPDAWQKIAECYASMNDYAAAANALSSLVSFYPQSPDILATHLRISDYYVKAGDLRNAKDKLNKFIVDYPDAPELFQARFRLAAILSAEQQYDLAIAEYQQIIDRARDNELKASALFEKGRLLEKTGKMDLAKTAYETISNRFTKTRVYPDALYAIGLFAYREKKHKEAIDLFEQTAKLPSASTTIKNLSYLRIGDIHFKNKDYDKALASYKKTLLNEKDPLTITESRFKLALAYEAVGQIPNAIEHLLFITDSLKHITQDTHLIRLAELRLAKNYTAQKQYRQALDWYNHFSDHYPEFEYMDRVWLGKAQLLIEGLQDYNEGAHQLEMLTGKYPKSRFADYAYYWLGRTYRLNQRIEKARDLLESFRYKFPGSRYQPEVDAELQMIRDYYSVNNETTVENIIGLIGSVIEGRPKDELELSYGKLFFDQLKKYDEAISIFRKILRREPSKPIAEEALYYTAVSYEKLAFPNKPAFSDSAIEYYKKLSKSSYADIAQKRIHELQLQKITDENERRFKSKLLHTNWLERFPQSPYRDQILFHLGQSLFELNELQNPADTVAQKSSRDKALKTDSVKLVIPVYTALSCFQEIVERYPKSPWHDDALFYLALSYKRLQKKNDFIRLIQQYLTLYPRGKYAVRSKYDLARYRQISGDAQSAIPVYEELLNSYFYTSYADSASQGIVQSYLDARMYRQAIQAYENHLAALSDEYSAVDILRETAQLHADVDYHVAYAYRQLNQFSKAIEFYEKYLFPDYRAAYAPEALWALADISMNKRDQSNALRYYKLLFDNYPQHPLAQQALKQSAEIHFDAERYNDARQLYTQLATLAKSPTDQMIFDSRVIVCTYRSGAIDKTTILEKEFTKKYEKEKTSRILFQNYQAEFLFELGRYYQYTLKNYELASKTYTRVIDQYRAADIVAEAMFQLGVIRFNQGKSKEGFDWFQQIIKRYPESDMIPGVYLRMAVEAFKLEQTQNAIEWAKYALQHPKIKNNDARVGTDFLIKVYKTVGYYENALVLIQRYLEQFPDDDPVNILSKKIDIGIMHRNLKSYDRAIEYLKELLKTATGEDEAEIQYHIAQTYYDRGQFRQALIEFLRIPYLQLGSKYDWSTAAKAQAAECYVKLEQYADAVKIFEEIIRTHGQSSEYGLFARQRLTEIRKLMKE